MLVPGVGPDGSSQVVAHDVGDGTERWRVAVAEPFWTLGASRSGVLLAFTETGVVGLGSPGRSG